ncbi:uncharacterized protein VTP21DRAFT_3912 [Calcarisporiella thermophila]|uniref:uncharacterized protein n=1 Tax=Calcarisporiella thermophila TaxID=911321 RepID=UPI003743D16E
MTATPPVTLLLATLLLLFTCGHAQVFMKQSRLATTVVNDTLYVYGGAIYSQGSNISAQNLLLINITRPFPLRIPALNAGSGIYRKGIPYASVGAVLFRAGNKVAAYGGSELGQCSNETFYPEIKADTNSSYSLYTWDNSAVPYKWVQSPKPTPPARAYAGAIVDKAGKVYIYGMQQTGSSSPLVYEPQTESWSEMATSGMAPSCGFPCAVHYLRSKNAMLVIDPFMEIYTLDLKTGVWTQLTRETGPTDLLNYYGSVITQDERVLVYGGLHQGVYRYNQDLLMFDTKTLNWSTVQTQGVPPSPRVFPGVAMVGSKLFILGGETQKCADADSNIYLLDTKNFTWLNAYEPDEDDFSYFPSYPSSPDIGMIVGITLGVLLGLAVVVGSVVLYLRKSKRRNHLPPSVDNKAPIDASEDASYKPDAPPSELIDPRIKLLKPDEIDGQT